MARAALGLSVRKFADSARVAPQTIVRFESGERLRPRTVISLQKVLEAAGVEFTDGRKPGVRLNMR
jgi:transcriptional regulator with XRE-family HTH domain